MTTESNITGIHHITAIASSARDNLKFYENTLGLRLVKQTVNFDDPYTYHLYYGDNQGSPGTILTFFPWENLPQGKIGTGMVTSINFTVPRPSIEFWTERLKNRHIPIKTAERFGEPVIQFADPHGLPVELTGLAAPLATEYWENGPVSETHAVRGFHSATATLTSLDESKALLVDTMGMRLHGQERNRFRFRMNRPSSPGNYYDIVIEPDLPPGRPGTGTVHHIAFRTRNEEAEIGWQSTLRDSGRSVTDIRDRKYFRSIYFHAPENVLFEIATDPPGFTVDESVDELGSSLKLPDQHETMRAEIEQRLPFLRSPIYRHEFKPSRTADDDGQTLVALHGTGGNEHDLLQVASAVNHTSAILSPRGSVLENGMPRFFKRLANNVFDEADVIQRANELSDFLVSAAREYGRNPACMTAIGYSNGANIAAAVMLLRPEVFSKAILVRPMLPLQNIERPDLNGTKVLILKGAHDAVIPADSTDHLVEVLSAAGAEVTTQEINGGHEITEMDLEVMSQWLALPEVSVVQCDSEPSSQATAG